MRIKMAEPLPIPSSSNPSNISNRGLTSLEAAKKSKLPAGGARPQTKMVSLNDIQARKALEIAQQEKGGKRKAAAAAAVAAAAATAVAPTADPTGGAVTAPGGGGVGIVEAPLAGLLLPSKQKQPKPPKLPKKHQQPHQPPPDPTESRDSGSLSSLGFSGDLDSQGLALEPAPPASRPGVPSVVDIHALFAESPLLTEEDKIIITNFFTEPNYQYPEANPTRRIKLNEAITEAGAREMMYLVLNFQDRTYQRTKKTKSAKKAKVGDDQKAKVGDD